MKAKCDFIRRLIPVLLTLVILTVNQKVFALLIQHGITISNLSNWKVWRITLLISLVILFFECKLSFNRVKKDYTDEEWVVIWALLIGWLISLLCYIAIAFFYWQLPEPISAYLFVGPAFGLWGSVLALLYVNG